MTIAERRERQRAERYELILDAARGLAEAEGWDAVTTRRLAGLIDYSQPVLYSHFKGKADIMAAVATRGFEELATRLRMETANVTGAPDVLRNVCAAYLDFARSRPVIYEAMFVLPTKIKVTRCLGIFRPFWPVNRGEEQPCSCRRRCLLPFQ